MQNLTARGIRLAAQFRSMGVPVIESYPGAAQDIMKIPRKRASLEFLQLGLAEFGIRGNFLDQQVSHDELDAITSALVGLFFWSGKFEALGNPEEEYLIIPDIKANPQAWKTRKVIGLSGPIAAGKTTAGEYLQALNFHYGRFSLVLAGILRDRGIAPIREALQKLGEEVNKDPGQRWLCQQLIRKLPAEGNLVIDGLRFPEDHATLVEAFGPAFLHIHIDAPHSTRQERFVAAGGTAKKFASASTHPVEASVTKLASLAHVIVKNDSTKESFLSEILQLVGSAKNRREEASACL
jgi:dephospho-CoA kinase